MIGDSLAGQAAGSRRRSEEESKYKRAVCIGRPEKD